MTPARPCRPRAFPIDGRPVKKLALAALTNGYVSPLVRPLVRGADTILTLHRFADPGRGVRGQDPAALRSDLAYLRKHRYNLVGVDEVVRRFVDGSPGASSAIAFTVDDGYYDWFEVAAPIFAEFDCPVTVFLITDFIGGVLWNWWDKVAHAVAVTRRDGVRIDAGGAEWVYRWNGPEERERAASDIVRRLERVATEQKLELIRTLATLLEVDLPDRVPPGYAAMTWDNVRAAVKGGATFGAHTVTHPILAQCSEEHCRQEIEESWRRVRQETEGVVSVFAYPNGQPHAISRREAIEVHRAGIAGAVTTHPRYVERSAPAGDPLARYLVPRFPYPIDRAHLIQLTTGLERAKLALGRAIRGGDRPVGTQTTPR